MKIFSKSTPTPEATRAAYDAKEAKKAKKLRRKVEKKIRSFERRILIPALKKKGSIALRDKQLKSLGLKLLAVHQGKPHGEEDHLSLCVDRASWQTPREMEDAFISLLEKYRKSGKFQVKGKFNKDGKVDRISVYPTSK